MKNLLWVRKYGLGSSSWLGWGLKPPPEKQEDISVGLGGRAVRVWWWIGCEMRSSESGWLIGYWTEQPSEWWCLCRWLRLCLDAGSQTQQGSFRPLLHVIPQMSPLCLSLPFCPISLSPSKLLSVLLACYLCLILGWTAHKAWCFRCSLSSGVFLAPFFSHSHAETRNPQSGGCAAWGGKPAGPLCSSHLSWHPRDAYGHFLVPS